MIVSEYIYVVVCIETPEYETGCCNDIASFDDVDEAIAMDESLNSKNMYDYRYYEVIVRLRA
jgi:hypothetical protein